MQVLHWLLIGVPLVLGQYDPHCGGKQVVVNLFEWKWDDIAEECELFLGPMNYCGVQVSPPNDHILLPQNNLPWWQRYHPVSYILISNSGNEAQFTSMVQRCNDVGVRIYADVILNHMTSSSERSANQSSAGSPYDGGRREFPAVPYSEENFTPVNLCPSLSGNINDYMDPFNVRNCYLDGLTDLYGAQPYVQEKLADYLNKLVSVGVAGVRIAYAKHMWPQDIKDVLERVNGLPTEFGFSEGSKLFVSQEVIDFDTEAVNASQYFDTGMVTEFRYAIKLANGIENYSQLYGLVDLEWHMAPTEQAIVFPDNQNSQRDPFLFGDVLTFKNARDYKQGVAYMLAYPYGFAQVMSSYNFIDVNQGPPNSSPGSPVNSDYTCDGGWVCEHRWNVMTKMVKFRNFAAGTNITNYWNNGRAVAFSRGDRCFFAMAKNGSLNVTLPTGLPPGKYYNLIDDGFTSVQVEENMDSTIVINNYDEPILAICIGNATELPVEPTDVTTDETTSVSLESTTETMSTSVPAEFQRTVIFIQKNPGSGNNQRMFLRGGIDHNVRENCTYDASTSPCAIPISVRNLGPGPAFDSYNFWSQGDTRLDWYGMEAGQGLFVGIPADGTPSAPTSNNPSSSNYNPLNKWGENYWMVDMDMNCSATEQGWFEIRAIVGNVLEPDIVQSALCSGSAGGATPYTSSFHMGRCGYLNLFYFGSSSCEIDLLDELPTGTTSNLPMTTPDQTTEQPTTTITLTDYQRTVIFIQLTTSVGDFVFVRGGIFPAEKPECTGDSDATSECAIPIKIRSLGSDDHYDAYNAWMINDTHLDWWGAQPDQGKYPGVEAQGTGLVWTTNYIGQQGYQPLNKYGIGYWMVDMEMDCLRTQDGWFEVRAFSSGADGVENTITQENCTGNAIANLSVNRPPFSSFTHAGHCGFVNVFLFDSPSCVINLF